MKRIESADFVLGANLSVIQGGALVIEDDAILFVGTELEACRRYPTFTLVSHPSCVIAPGFINAHMHLYGVLAHGLTPPLPIVSFESFLYDYWWPLVEDVLDLTMLEAATEASALELIASGVTTVCDVLEAPFLGIEGLVCEQQVLERVGLRSILSIEASERVSFANGVACLKDTVAFHNQLTDNPLISTMLCLHTSFTCTASLIAEAKRLASENALEIQLHLNESDYEPLWCEKHHSLRSALWYEKLGLLDNHLLAAQCVQLSLAEIAALASTSVRAVHVPLSNCEVGGGIAPVPALLKEGVGMGLGTDGFINNFFEVMRAAFLIHKGKLATPEVMSARQVWKMATQEGGKALYGPSSRVGVLDKGYFADYQIVSIEDIPTRVTELNIFDHLILFRNPEHVVEVFVGGKRVKPMKTPESGSLALARARTREESLRLAEKGQRLVL
jgi:cytosine/adenosine deaminase-related metal-dependent hydrolase